MRSVVDRAIALYLLPIHCRYRFQPQEIKHSKYYILNQLEKDGGHACTMLAKAIRSMPQYNETTLHNLVEEVKATSSNYADQEEWRRAIACFCHEVRRSLHQFTRADPLSVHQVTRCIVQLLQSMLLDAQQKLEPHIRYWKA